MERLNRAKIVITNFHAFLLREKVAAGKLDQAASWPAATATRRAPSPRRPTRWSAASAASSATSKNIVVLNDEAHHCYRGKPAEARRTTRRRSRATSAAEAEQRDEEARVWITGLEAVKSKIGIRAIYDLSATPFFLRGSGYPEGTLFPWVVSATSR